MKRVLTDGGAMVIAGVIFMVAGVVPLFTNDPDGINAAFVAVGAMFIAIGGGHTAAARRKKRDPES